MFTMGSGRCVYKLAVASGTVQCREDMAKNRPFMRGLDGPAFSSPQAVRPALIPEWHNVSTWPKSSGRVHTEQTGIAARFPCFWCCAIGSAY